MPNPGPDVCAQQGSLGGGGGCAKPDPGLAACAQLGPGVVEQGGPAPTSGPAQLGSTTTAVRGGGAKTPPAATCPQLGSSGGGSGGTNPAAVGSAMSPQLGSIAVGQGGPVQDCGPATCERLGSSGGGSGGGASAKFRPGCCCPGSWPGSRGAAAAAVTGARGTWLAVSSTWRGAGASV